MANISSVNGILYITAASTMECEKIYKLIKFITNKWVYSFNMYDEFTISEVKVAHSESDDEVTMETPFNGEGRWSFQNNAQSFGVWLGDSIRIHSNPTIEIFEAAKELMSLKFVLEFEYDEDEPGQQFIGVGKTKLFHIANTPLEEMEILEDEFVSHELTVENLVEYRGFDEEYAKEYLEEYYPNS